MADRLAFAPQRRLLPIGVTLLTQGASETRKRQTQAQQRGGAF
jgi:hypothetical protein